MSSGKEPQVVFLCERVTHYRTAFFARTADRLAKQGIRFTVTAAVPTRASTVRNDLADPQDLEWLTLKRTWRLNFGRRRLVWHRAFRHLLDAELLVAEQGSRLLSVYPAIPLKSHVGPKVALWGHGINRDRDAASRVGEAMKQRVASQADWWFCYTEGTASIVSDLGVDRDRITVVQNAVDTSGIRAARDNLTPDDIAAVRRELGLGDGPVALWLSSIYDRKRPEFMVSAADAIRADIADFELLVVGDGPQRHIFDEAAETRPWLHVLGARNGLDAVPPAGTASILVNPGLVGLTVLDGFALGLPMITCDLPYHSPEIEYLQHDLNGLLLPRHATSGDFAEACVRLLTDRQELGRLSDAARQASFQYTLEEMVERFTSGILQALESERPRSVRRKLRNPFSRTEPPDGEQV